jgi:hypothetical protein
MHTGQTHEFKKQPQIASPICYRSGRRLFLEMLDFIILEKLICANSAESG